MLVRLVNWTIWRRGAAVAIASLLATGVFAAAGALAQVPPIGASAEIRDAAGRLVANAEFREGRGEVLITMVFASPSPLTGTHGLRIHEVGRCDPPGYTTAGNGFNPLNRKHGRQNPDGPQVGDLPNVNFTTGLTSYNTSAMGATLGGGPTSLLGPNRTAVVVYEKEDDQLTDPDGKAGGRIACGVINAVSAIAASPIPAVQQPGVVSRPSPVTPPQGAAAPPQAAQAPGGQPAAQPAPAKPASSPIVVPPPVVARPASPAASPAAVGPAQLAVPTAAAPTAAGATQGSGGGLGVLPALLIAVVGVGLVGAGYLLRRRAQLQR